MRYGSSAECTFSFTANSCDGAMGTASIYSYTSKTACDEKAALSPRSERVSTFMF